jgi:hypothetical protein
VSSLTLGSEIDGAIYRNKLRLSDWWLERMSEGKNDIELDLFCTIFVIFWY